MNKMMMEQKPNSDVFKILKSSSGTEILTIPSFDSEGTVKTFFTTRIGGVSPSPYKSLNFGGRNDDSVDNVKKNRELVFDCLGYNFSTLVFPQQIHSDSVECFRSEDSDGSGNITFPDTDAVITAEKDVLLTSLHADCLPVYLFDPQNKVIGLAHAGWKGTKLSIGAKTAQKMVSELGADIESIKAVIGPGISKCCFEVSPNTYEEIKQYFDNIDDFAVNDQNGKYHIDLKQLNVFQLKRIGITDIQVSSFCTVCDSDLFFSHRKEKGITGRMGAGIGLLR